MRTSLQTRSLGIAFVALVLLGGWLVDATFQQRFTRFDEVTLHADRVGLSLPSRADVKVRGELIGEVLRTSTSREGATLTLGLDPDKIGAIPANVTASILPKTLFGEKYVSLVVPDRPSSSALRGGDRIYQTDLPVEVEKVLDDIYPLLRTVQPEQLNYTLTALATALEGRGEELGENLEVLDGYLRKLNPQVPALVRDLRLLGKVSDDYSQVLPEIGATLRNTVKTGGTLEAKQGQLNAFLVNTTSFSDTATSFLDANGDNIVRLGRLSEPQLRLLRRYSPEFPCLLGGINRLAPRLADTFRGFTFHIRLRTLPKQPRGYAAGEQPVYGDGRGPHCGTLPTPPFSPRNPQTEVPDFDDGASKPAKRTATGFDRTPVTGTAAEKSLIVPLTAPVLGVPADRVGDLTTLLFGPLARGSEVSVR